MAPQCLCYVTLQRKWDFAGGYLNPRVLRCGDDPDYSDEPNIITKSLYGKGRGVRVTERCDNRNRGKEDKMIPRLL